VLPGAEVTLLQRWPAFVVRLGYAELALDRETARMIRVRHESPDAKTPRDEGETPRRRGAEWP